MSAPDFMPIYWKDFHAKTHHLSVLEKGALLLLLGACWQQENRLPVLHPIQVGEIQANLNRTSNKFADDTTAFLEQKGWAIDDKAIARIIGMDVRTWRTVRANILPFFAYTSDGFLCNKRIGEELTRARELIEKRRIAGLKGAEGKYGKGYGSDVANAQQADANLQLPLQNKSFSSKAKADENRGDLPAIQPLVEPKPIDPSIHRKTGLPLTDQDWMDRLKIGRDQFRWHADWGPMPNEPGCVVPVSLVTKHDGKVAGWRDWAEDAAIKADIAKVRV